MKVDPLSGQRVTAPRKTERGQGGQGAGFADALGGAEETASGSAVSGGGALQGLDALLALQEMPDALTGRARARQHGERLLDILDQIRLDILAGRLPRARLEQLSGQLAQRREAADDPQLAAIIEQIELRAAVELAKMERG